ncbi:hypothetical protein BCR34DRAFT_76870 [Clohesyomyces aquaticus]|uniref:Uncharacterized protein n=1 Tax=Clohesyomyces aquaticus TaxID=1231657 RepID=A0A1Y1YYE1_9PLEO|nr:hypothetical protein BCR34DRAFT_76870 [Clohesyomyces aquaticus]
MVSKYMRLSLTQLSDILPAISGCARQLSELTGDKYVAGIWRKSFANYLLWHIKDSRKSRARPKWNAPTWSWASMASGQELLFFEKVNVDCLKQLLSSSVINRIQCVPKSDRNPFGEISPGTGSLRFHAQLFRCHIRYFCVSSKRALDMAGGMKHQRHYRLHQQKYRQKYDKVSIKLCDLPVPGVDTRGGTFDLLPDIPLRDALEWRESQVCENCKLAQISLLQVGNVTEGNMRRDYFMMLRAIGVGVGSYERIGLATLLRQTVDQRKVWFEEVWQKGALPPEEITIN